MKRRLQYNKVYNYLKDKHKNDLNKCIAFYILKIDDVFQFDELLISFDKHGESLNKMKKIETKENFCFWTDCEEGRKFIKENYQTLIYSWFKQLYN